MTTFRRKALAVTIAGGLLMAACGNDDDDVSTDDTDQQAPMDDSSGGDTIKLDAVDYGYLGNPGTISAGDKLTLENRSENELHEIVAIRIPDGEDRSVEEMLQLSEEELAEAVPDEGPPAAVIIAPPGEEGFAVHGDGTLTEPGRYALICFIPIGADPDAYMDPANQTDDGPPDVDGGPPHFTQGMFTEITVQ